MQDQTAMNDRGADRGQPVVVKAPDGTAICYELFGAETGDCCIFLHGGGQSRGAWRRAASALAGNGVTPRAATMDLRGHGDSDWSSSGDYSLAAHASDLTAVIRDLGSRVVLVGASLGGNVAAKVAADLGPKIVSALVLVDTTPQNNAEGMRMITGFLREATRGYASVGEAAASLARILHRDPPEDLSGLARAMRRTDDGKYVFGWDPAVASAEAIGDTSDVDRLSGNLGRVRCPVLLLKAGASELVDDDSIRQVRGILPTIRVVEVPGIRHMISGDQNDVYASYVIDFLRGPPDGS